ncbi:MAG: HNH endonuclease signature motif containing protein [Terricaulis sp.]
MSDEKTPVRERHCRRRPSSKLKRMILEAQHGQCLACGATLGDVEFDHVIPLGLGGDNAPDNWAAVCPPCHAVKTRFDLKRIAKAKRQRRYHETGRSRAKSTFAPITGIRACSFDKSKRRHVNGMVTRNCSCVRCRSMK